MDQSLIANLHNFLNFLNTSSIISIYVGNTVFHSVMSQHLCTSAHACSFLSFLVATVAGSPQVIHAAQIMVWNLSDCSSSSLDFLLAVLLRQHYSDGNKLKWFRNKLDYLPNCIILLLMKNHHVTNHYHFGKSLRKWLFNRLSLLGPHIGDDSFIL